MKELRAHAIIHQSTRSLTVIDFITIYRSYRRMLAQCFSNECTM